MAYRDLNKNGVLDPYEDPRRPVDERVEDLLARMTLAEKAGLLFHTYVAFRIEDSAAFVNADLGPTPTGAMVTTQRINHFNFPPIPEPRLAAQWHNKVQALAEDTRLGIPVTFSSDPLHGFSDNSAANLAMPAFSRWPEPPGLAAIGDSALVQEFGDIARREYVAVGIRVALHPTADLATEPRWARTNGTFGEDADLASQMTAAYIRGFQGEAFGPDSVACMTKHFPGGGPQKDGEDAHFAYGRDRSTPATTSSIT